jgi:3',5'-nucleoside bisphosphate phosphatase
VVNDQTYSDEALQIALDNNLTIMGTSDIHKLIDWEFKVPEGGHRPITLVFATAKTETAIKEALFARRTVVNFNNRLIGREEFLVPLIRESLDFKTAAYPGKTDVLSVVIENKTNCDFILQNNTAFTFHNANDVVIIRPGDKNILQVKTGQRLKELVLKFEVLNGILAPHKHPMVEWRLKVD